MSRQIQRMKLAPVDTAKDAFEDSLVDTQLLLLPERSIYLPQRDTTQITAL